MRHQPMGTGYKRSRDADVITMGCPNDTCIGYELKAHINLKDLDGDWYPVGDDSNPFIAHFEGNHYTIANLKIDGTDNDNVGLFGITSKAAMIRNVGLIYLDIATTRDNVGGLVGDNQGTITNSYVIGKVTGSNNVGGLVGVHGTSATNTVALISTSHAVVFVGDRENAKHHIGGLVGNNHAIINASYVVAQEVAGEDNIGVLVGSNNGQILNNHAATSILIKDREEVPEGSCKLSGNSSDSHESNTLIGECNNKIFGE